MRSDPEELIERVQELSEQVERLEDARARGLAQDLAGAILDFHGDGLERILATIGESAEGESIRERLAGDGTVASLLLIHDLYPVPLVQRVEEALDSVRPYLESHGGDIELLGVEEEVARLQLRGSCDGCPASSATLELAVTSALEEAAPDLRGIEVEGAVEAGQQGVMPEISGTELPVIQSAPPVAEAGPSWHELNGELDGLGEGEVTAVEVEGRRLVVAMVDGSMLAYLDACPSCESPLAGGELSEGVLACPGCERRFFLPRAGRSLDDERLHLGPVPLLGSNGQVRVALER